MVLMLIGESQHSQELRVILNRSRFNFALAPTLNPFLVVNHFILLKKPIEKTMMNLKIKKNAFISSLFILAISVTPIFAQQTRTLTLQDAIQYVAKNYPTIKAKQAEYDAAQKNISINKSAFIPSLDVSYQFNYSTYNNIIGLYSSQGILPISGPPSSTNNYTPTFGSAGSLYLNWQPITFGLRSAQIKLSNADASNKNYNLQNEIFEQQIKLISSYLDVLVANQIVKVYQENLERTNFNLSLSKGLTINGLRPGVDTALFAAEKAKAEVELLNTQKQFSLQQIILSQQLGSDSLKIEMDTLYFHHLPLSENSSVKNTPPIYNLFLSQLDYQKAKEKTIKLDVLPKLNLWGIAYGRGSGAGSNTATDGFTFSRYNFGAGVQLIMPLLHFTDVRLKSNQQQFFTQSAEEKLKQVDLDLRKQQEIADTTFANSIKIIDKYKVQLSSSLYAYDAMKGRYEAGLANYSDLIQTQYNLVKAQTELKKAYWDVWKAWLYKAMINGDVNLFINSK